MKKIPIKNYYIKYNLFKIIEKKLIIKKNSINKFKININGLIFNKKYFLLFLYFFNQYLY
jgi:hypothetical protein